MRLRMKVLKDAALKLGELHQADDKKIAKALLEKGNIVNFEKVS
jgi:hypothetical protein